MKKEKPKEPKFKEPKAKKPKLPKLQAGHDAPADDVVKDPPPHDEAWPETLRADAEQKPVQLRLPVVIPDDAPHLLAPVVVVPEKIDPEKIVPLPERIFAPDCDVTLVDTTFIDNYLWLKIPADCALRLHMKPGQTIKADVTFLPPGDA